VVREYCPFTPISDVVIGEPWIVNFFGTDGLDGSYLRIAMNFTVHCPCAQYLYDVTAVCPSPACFSISWRLKHIFWTLIPFRTLSLFLQPDSSADLASFLATLPYVSFWNSMFFFQQPALQYWIIHESTPLLLLLIN